MSESRSSSSKIRSKKSSDEILGELFSSFKPEDGEAEEGEMNSASSPSGSEEESAHKRAKKAKKAKKAEISFSCTLYTSTRTSEADGRNSNKM